VPALPPIFHVGLVVADLEASMAAFGASYGLERSRPTFDLEVEDGLVYGEPQSFVARFAFLSLGGTELELIQPISGVSPYALFLEQHGEGVHHLAFIVESIDAQLEQVRGEGGSPTLLLDAKIGADGRFVYVENTASGVAIELVEAPSDIDLSA
jgi:methylmalonyl-CoA/ethylmalonyl-CoA epimerase